MKVKMLRNPSASYGCALKEGDIGIVDGSIGKALIAAGIAVEIECPKPELPLSKTIADVVSKQSAIEAIPTTPAIAEVKSAKIETSPKAAVEETKKLKMPTDKAGYRKPQEDKDSKE